MTDDRYVDGNAVAGIFLQELGVDVSAATVLCAGCGQARRFAENHAYDRGPGIVMRCPQCGAITARMTRTTTDLWLDLRGSASWRIPVQPETT
jgi:hypothetical protein